ncbi:hypothetical protein NIGALANA_163 [Bacillus phage Nigalana]|uniref:Uncharacterized protein n=1 Tax=Bacillus phage PPIsBest TaxID=2024234 RepID=A0A222Z317_9CAUD|nr:hypothetical protein BI005_gp163 [Bacillus phage Nigalana]YP_009287040.1 hypothetical protein BI006_gp164 [Bacillus phage Nemo]ASR78420.1 hypothetical protein PPISBEST_163 [Bacillus phage PPIsBest]ASR78622.1 hypothetical protein BUBS_165 [Bacillus phage Bubs]AMW61313.1 hypothetical protein NIGALANA_163 [Bacillus phage Nigalana]AMW63680.1 hypothetical protein NEMO_164 [Bacillus phage Nemo]
MHTENVNHLRNLTEYAQRLLTNNVQEMDWEDLARLTSLSKKLTENLETELALRMKEGAWGDRWVR